ncbi:hypothetical protein C8P68_102397 [Mucilaginibacter yixingensis]|uniref:Uncharacterized protein n=1 Tax=Mucilaginibacter yixingensis TaxID=1295612 RepID=A0A2T5JCT6_9SPHI|nr:hypothetical protein C8P68_102397 [Mucilaginibacter yixingensis]
MPCEAYRNITAIGHHAPFYKVQGDTHLFTSELYAADSLINRIYFLALSAFFKLLTLRSPFILEAATSAS